MQAAKTLGRRQACAIVPLKPIVMKRELPPWAGIRLLLLKHTPYPILSALASLAPKAGLFLKRPPETAE
jgi:hypothetical protein